MLSFLEGTLLISNILLILFAVIYGVLIVKRRRVEESNLWLYFLIASGIYFLSETISVVDDIFDMNLGLVRAGLRISFGVIVLFAFLSKYSALGKEKISRHSS